MVQRVVATGYTYTTLGENIAAGQATVESVITGWTKPRPLPEPDESRASGHWGALCRSDTSSYRYYWTMVSGGPEGPMSSEAPAPMSLARV